MTDTKQLHKIGKLVFGKIFRYNLGEDVATDYIVAFEPQGRGAWHAHACVFQKKKGNLTFETLARFGKNGFVKREIGKAFQKFGFIGIFDGLSFPMFL